MKNSAIDLIISFWLLVVAAQYISSYFYDLGLDFKPVYYAMLVFTLALVIWKAVHPSSNGSVEQSSETVRIGESRRTRRSRR